MIAPSLAPSIPEQVFDEFRASAIPDRLTEINVQWVKGDDAIAILTEQRISEIQRNQTYLTKPARQLLERYQCIGDGGWLAYGCDVEGKQQGLVDYFKPVRPRLDFEKGKLKLIKYDSPLGSQALPIVPWVDDESAALIYQKYGVEPLERESFWQLVWRCNLPIAFVEGLKKALSLIAHGVPAIALRGVSCWHKKGTRELHPQIQHFATAGRTIHIIFDVDEKLSTKINVGCEARKLGTELEALGCKVFVPAWDASLGKGVDDVIFGQGEQGKTWLDKVIESAPTLKATKRNAAIAAALDFIQKHGACSYPIERLTEGEYLPALPPLKKGSIHVLDASMNAGKTTRIKADWISEAIAQGWNVLVLAPLNSLGQQTAQNCGLPHIHDFGTSAEQNQALWATVSASHGIVMCVDSLHRIPGWFFERPLLLILDECNQTVDHTCQGNTLGSRWSPTLEKFAAIATHAASTGAIALSEDGLPDRAVKFVQALSDCENLRLFRHRKLGTPWDCSVFQGQVSGFRARFLEAVSKGQRLLFVTSSQREAKRMERAIARQQPTAKVTRIDSQTNQLGQFRAFFESPDAWLEANQPDVLILSPSAKSGVSVQGGVSVEDAYFDSVWGYFPSLATDTHMQLLGRFRPAVPRFVFVPPVILGNADEQGKPGQIKKRLKQNAKAIAGVYGLGELLDPTNEKAELMSKIENAVMDYLATAKALAGCQKAIAYDALVDRLEAAGHVVQCLKLEKDKATAELWKEIQEQIWREEAEAIATRKIDTEIHTLEWARKKLDSLECSYEDRLTAHKILWRGEFPGMLFDDSEECYQALCHDYGAMRRGVLLQARAENLEAAKAGDREAAESILSQKLKALHHLPKNHIKAGLVAVVLALLDGTPYSNTDARVIAIKQRALKFADEIKYFWGLDIRPTQTPVEIAHKLLKKLGIRVNRSDRHGEIQVVARPGKRTEKRDKVYRVDLSVNPTRARLLEAARRKLSESVSPISINRELTTLGIEDTPQDSEQNSPFKELVGSVVTRAGSMGRWVIEAIAGQIAQVKQVGGSGFDEFQLNELTLVEF